MRLFLKIIFRIILGIFSVISVSLIIVILYGIYQANFSTKARIAAKNIENCRKIRQQMSKNEVLEIMGNPDTIMNTSKNSVYYCYEENDDSHPFVEIEIDSNSKVIGVYAPIYDK